MYILLGIIIPFIGTTLGSAMVYFMKNKKSINMEKILLGFTSGIMVSASIWSLIIPSIELASGKIAWFPAAVGFIIGILLLILLDKIFLGIENKTKYIEHKDILMMITAVTVHNIPEGIAVGVAFAGTVSIIPTITLLQAMILSIGIAIQNFPEGAIISMPLKSEGLSKNKSFILGMISGAVEPVAAFITLLLTSILVPILPYLLSFAAGAMFYVVINELIPKTNSDNNIYGTIGFTLGFLIMLILDVSFG